MDVKIYINEQYYMTVSVPETDTGGFNMRDVMLQTTGLRDSPAVAEFLVDGKMVIRVEPVKS